MADPLVSNQGLNIGGHKIPFAFVMAAVGVVTVFLIMKSKSGGGIAVGPQPTAGTATTDPYGANLALGSPMEAQFANLGQGIFGLQQTLQALAQTPAAAAAVTPATNTSFLGPNVIATATPWGAENLWGVNSQGQLAEQWTDFNNSAHTATTNRGILATGLDPKTALSTYWVGNNEVLIADSPAGVQSRFWWDSGTQIWHQGGYNGPSPPVGFQNLGQTAPQ